MDSSLNRLLLLHFARTVSDLTIFNSSIIWNSTFFFNWYYKISAWFYGLWGIMERKGGEKQESCPTYKQRKHIYDKAGSPHWFKYFRVCQTLWILAHIHHNSHFTKKCKKTLFTRTSGQTTLKILLSSSLVKMTCQKEVLGCLYLNPLKFSWNKEEIYLQ